MVVSPTTHLLSVGSAPRTYVTAVPGPPYEQDCKVVMAGLAMQPDIAALKQVCA